MTRGAEFWQSPCGAAITRAMQEHYGDIIISVVQRAIGVRDADPAMSEHLYKIAEELNPEKISGCDSG